MTNHWNDIQYADVIMIIGSNAAENHPISFKYVQKSLDNGGKLISVDPRYTRTSSMADVYAPLRPGTDIAFMNGIIWYALEKDLIQKDYVVEYTNASLLVNPKYSFDEVSGLFSGYQKGANGGEYDNSTWAYQKDDKGIPKRDKTLKDPNCVYQLMKTNIKRYTPKVVSDITGCPVDTFKKIAEMYVSTHKKDKVATIMYAMGTTQHTIGTQNIRTYAMLQLLMGNVGMAGGGINALRGESNVQGSTDHCILYHILPGYLKIPKPVDGSLAEYLDRVTPKTKDPKSANWWQHYPKYTTSLLKAWYGDAATKENDFGFHWVPKSSKPYPHIVLFEDMYAGKHKGGLLMGTNPIVGGPNADKEAKALEKLDFLICADIWETDTSIFWKRPGANPKAIKTEVFLLPMASSVEKEGSVSNSGRWAQWRYKAQNPPGVAKTDLDFINELFLEIRKLYAKEGGKLAEPILKANWNYTHKDEKECDPHLVAKEINGYTWKKTGEQGKLVKNFTKLKDDGTTACGNWLYSGSYNGDGNNMARRGLKDAPNKLEMYPNWSWCWPVNRRIIYNRASVDLKGNPWNPAKPVIKWNGDKWVGDVPDGGWKPGTKHPFIMLNEGLGRLFAKNLKDGPLPEHYEPMESPTTNKMNSQKVNPATVILPSTRGEYGDASQFPYVGTTYRMTEHWQAGAMTRNLPWLTELVPDMFCEISPTLAKKKGIKNGDKVKISSKRGSIESIALVTERVQPYKIHGKMVEMVGMVWHFGDGCAKKGGTANKLTPHIGDANTMIPEFKAFLVDIEKV